MKSAVTVSLVSEARGGPFVFWDDLAGACAEAADRGFDGIEIFAPGPDAVDVDELKQLLDDHGLELAAVGTGAGMVKHGWTLTDPRADVRRQAVAFVRAMIDFGGAFGAPAIIGSMQGRWSNEVHREQALQLLTEALNELGPHAEQFGVPLIFEPLNRYETNLVNTLGDGVELLDGLKTRNVRLLADLFHMNIEEADMAEAIRLAGDAIGHVHFVDSNRWAAGFGHIDFPPILAALKEIRYERYLSAEALPRPDSRTAAEQTIASFRNLTLTDES